ncbi:dihydroneopterin aldolase [Facklamia sp. DSM 111018]|uniref:7,8-dihydroneopterin aldolase n=1 Tax=Facklamia lactis TaxID=2749967 RepID=A0ABS0LN53_9LACT|nr:dihydroneopterin aldolase [Facklamia lactis]MBG9979782.1 dihydroneopterin aldolase [Facklamia lactis]MBG9985538.1 dihydroneopterin aldolase [Facklamia lactis]
MFKIKLNNMLFHSYIGVFPEEKKLGQNIAIDLTVKIKSSVTRDDIDETVSYAVFYDKIAEYIKESRADLIETMAFEIIDLIKQASPDKIESVKVNLRKLQVPIDGILDSAEVEMEA